MHTRNFLPQGVAGCGLLMVLPLSLGLISCGKAPEPPAPVQVVKLMTLGSIDASGAVPATAYSGQVHARVESLLSFRVAGKMISRPAQLGQVVRAGQVLARLDASDYQLGAQAATAQLQAAGVQRDLAAADLKRFENLRAQGYISGAELERRSAQSQAASAQWNQARAQAAAQGNQSRYAQLLADRAGVVTAVFVEAGGVVGAGQSVVQLAQSGPRDVWLEVSEDALSRFTVGRTVQVQAWNGQSADTQTVWPARVRERAASIDANTRTAMVKIAIEAVESSAPLLGSTVRVLLAGTAPAAAPQESLTVPLSALYRSGNKTAVWVYDGGKGVVNAQAVSVIGIEGNRVQLHAAGGNALRPTQQIVAAGANLLREGQAVLPYRSKAQPALESTATPAQEAL